LTAVPPFWPAHPSRAGESMNRLHRHRVVSERFLLRILRSLRSHLGFETTTYIDERVGQYRRYWEEAASALSAEFEALTDSIWEVRRDGARTRIAHYVTEFDNPVTLRLAGDKALLYRLAGGTGISLPEHVVIGIDSVDEAQGLLARTGGPCVVKPARDTASGLGITTYVGGRYQLEWAVALASIFCPEVLVESQVPGESYRLLFLNGRMIHAVRRRGTRVQADGIHTVQELAARARVGPLDHFVERTLAAQGWAADAVPPNGTSVLLRGLPPGQSRTRELRTVYDEDATELIGPDLVAEVRTLVSRLGVSFAGIDVVTVDPSRSLTGSGALIEINTTPGIHHHDVHRNGGQPFRVGEAVLSELLSCARPETTSRTRPDSPGMVD